MEVIRTRSISSALELKAEGMVFMAITGPFGRLLTISLCPTAAWRERPSLRESYNRPISSGPLTLEFNSGVVDWGSAYAFVSFPVSGGRQINVGWPSEVRILLLSPFFR
jgi:hypothetical protein